jgi:hypothetical protein
MNFSPEGYKVTDVFFFGKVAELMTSYTYGDVVVIKNPNILNGVGGFALNVARESKIEHLGESDEYGTCSEKKCEAFINTTQDLMCSYHIDLA